MTTHLWRIGESETVCGVPLRWGRVRAAEEASCLECNQGGDHGKAVRDGSRSDVAAGARVRGSVRQDALAVTVGREPDA